MVGVNYSPASHDFPVHPSLFGHTKSFTSSSTPLSPYSTECPFSANDTVLLDKQNHPDISHLSLRFWGTEYLTHPPLFSSLPYPPQSQSRFSAATLKSHFRSSMKQVLEPSRRPLRNGNGTA
jgi:hypothetical protein